MLNRRLSDYLFYGTLAIIALFIILLRIAVVGGQRDRIDQLDRENIQLQAEIDELNEKLAGYKPTDYLLLVGNPCLIGWAVAIATHKTGGSVRLLQWSGKDKKYIGILANIFS